MESRFQRVFLTALLAISTLAISTFAITISLPVYAQDDDDGEEEPTILDAVINPDIERRVIDEDEIDTENFELGFFTGVMSVEDFGSNSIYGMRFSYHITEDFFLEASYGSTQTSETSFETLSGGSTLLTEEERKLDYYNISLGITLLPGEVFIGKRWAFNTNYYIIGGAGNTVFAGNEYFTYNFGGGFRLFATDWLAFRVDVRNHIFTHNILGEDKEIQNLETHLGMSLYF